MDKLKQKTMKTVFVVIAAYLCIILAQVSMSYFQPAYAAVNFILLVVAILFGYLLFAVRNETFHMVWNRWSDITANMQEGVFTDGDCVYSCNPPAAKKILHIWRTKRIFSLLVFIVLAFVFCIPGFYTQPLHSSFSLLVEICRNLGKILTDISNVNLFFRTNTILYWAVSPVALQFMLLTITFWWFLQMHFCAGVRSPILNKVGTPANV